MADNAGTGGKGRALQASTYAEFVAQFRAGVEESMALVEKEVALLDALEGTQEQTFHVDAAHMSDDQVAALQQLLQDRILTATSLQVPNSL